MGSNSLLLANFPKYISGNHLIEKMGAGPTWDYQHWWSCLIESIPDYLPDFTCGRGLYCTWIEELDSFILYLLSILNSFFRLMCWFFFFTIIVVWFGFKYSKAYVNEQLKIFSGGGHDTVVEKDWWGGGSTTEQPPLLSSMCWESNPSEVCSKTLTMEW